MNMDVVECPTHTRFTLKLGNFPRLVGQVGRVLLPPSKAVALVEFLAASDARKAFKRLAYTRFQHVPLYLEWAPVKVCSWSLSSRF